MKDMTYRDVEAITDPHTRARCLLCGSVLLTNEADMHRRVHGYPLMGAFTLTIDGREVAS